MRYNDCELFRIKRKEEILLLQKNIGVMFFAKPSTFNSICWSQGVKQTPATSEELAVLRKLNAVERGTRKANLLSFGSITTILEHYKRVGDLELLKQLIAAPANTVQYGNISPSSKKNQTARNSFHPSVPAPVNNNNYYSQPFAVNNSDKISNPITPTFFSHVSPAAAAATALSPASPIPTAFPTTCSFSLSSPCKLPTQHITEPTTIQPTIFKATTSLPNISANHPVNSDDYSSNNRSSDVLESVSPPPDVHFATGNNSTNTDSSLVFLNSSMKHDELTKCNQDANKKNKKYTLSEHEISAFLQAQLLELQSFWMEPNNLARQAAAVGIVTHTKRRERVLCYLGWLKHNMHVEDPTLFFFDVAASAENRKYFEDYITYLKQTRKLSDGTVVGKCNNHACAQMLFF